MIEKKIMGFVKKCPKCGKVFQSLNSAQLSFNYGVHYEQCKAKVNKKEVNRK